MWIQHHMLPEDCLQDISCILKGVQITGTLVANRLHFQRGIILVDFQIQLLIIFTLERLIHLLLIFHLEGEDRVQGLIGVLKETLSLLKVPLFCFEPFWVKVAEKIIDG